jgi:hypothetical protein
MKVTEAGRKHVASTGFPQEYLQSFRNRQEECTTVDDKGGLMMWLIMVALCGLPVDYKPAPQEVDAFMAEHAAEVQHVLRANVIARLTSDWKKSSKS